MGALLGAADGPKVGTLEGPLLGKVVRDAPRGDLGADVGVFGTDVGL